MHYVWDPEKRLSNLKKHGVDFVDAIAVLEDELALTVSQIENGEIRFKTVGTGSKAGVLLVIHTEEGEDTIAIISARAPELQIDLNAVNTSRAQFMSEDFSKGKRGVVVKPDPNKERITIRLDRDIVDHFRSIVVEAGGGNYQSLINTALRELIEADEKALEKRLRKIIREELKAELRKVG